MANTLARQATLATAAVMGLVLVSGPPAQAHGGQSTTGQSHNQRPTRPATWPGGWAFDPARPNADPGGWILPHPGAHNPARSPNPAPGARPQVQRLEARNAAQATLVYHPEVALKIRTTGLNRDGRPTLQTFDRVAGYWSTTDPDTREGKSLSLKELHDALTGPGSHPTPFLMVFAPNRAASV
jgi:hypothetical protein